MPEKKKHKKHQFLLGHVHTYIHTKETMKRNEYSEMNIKKCSPTYLWRSFILSWAFSQVNKLNSAGNWIEFVQRGRLTVFAEWNANSKQWKSKFSYPMCCWCWNLFLFIYALNGRLVVLPFCRFNDAKVTGSWPFAFPECSVPIRSWVLTRKENGRVSCQIFYAGIHFEHASLCLQFHGKTKRLQAKAPPQWVIDQELTCNNV